MRVAPWWSSASAEDAGSAVGGEWGAAGESCREGESAEQLRIRRRLISFLRRALARWSAYWGVSWLRLPAGHLSKKILSEKPEAVPPDAPWMDDRPA